MFELSVALKYLTPRWRQLSVSIISIISILVITLVVWLIVVFFSVTHGLEKSWIQKLTALTAPIRITPTEAYYNSYYYQIDQYSSASNYNAKTIGEKLASSLTDPYDPEFDQELSTQISPPDRHADGSLKDLTKEAYQSIQSLDGIEGLAISDFEMTISNLRMRLVRAQANQNLNQTFLTQATYIGSFDKENPALMQALLPIRGVDVQNLLQTLSFNDNSDQQQLADELPQENNAHFQQKLKQLFSYVVIRSLKTTEGGWPLSKKMIPENHPLKALALIRGERMAKIYLPENNGESLKSRFESAGYTVQEGTLLHQQDKLIFTNAQGFPSSVIVPVLLPENLSLNAQIIPASLDEAKRPSDLRFAIHFILQGKKFEGEVPLRGLSVNEVEASYIINDEAAPTPLWVHQKNVAGPMQLALQADPLLGEAILLPKSFKEAGARLGDQGYLSYYAPTLSAVQEQRLQVYVAGFYDPGIIPIGGKFILANKNVTTLIHGSQGENNAIASNGINVRFSDLDQADAIKAALKADFEKRGIDGYWKIETFREFDHTKDLIQQLHSERNIWTLLAGVIIIVACSNIISMLIILVNDKKEEIGILRSMGASSGSIALIFGICGVVMGMIGSIIGTLLAVLTLRNLKFLVDWIGQLQGHELFNPIFYGNTLPNKISPEALVFVVVATAITSLVAGVVPAVKASLLRPSAILRSE